MSFINRIKYNFIALCCFSAFGFSFLFISCSALAQDLVIEYYSGNESNEVTFPIYFSFSPTDNHLTYIYLSKNGYLGDWKKYQLNKAIIDHEGFKWCKLSDVVSVISSRWNASQSYLTENQIIVSADGRRVRGTISPRMSANYEESYSKHFFYFCMWGWVLYRANLEVNGYDVLYNISLGPYVSSIGSFPSNRLPFVSIDDTNGTGLIAYNGDSGNFFFYPEDMKTYQFTGSFSVKLTASGYKFMDDRKHSLPLEIDNFNWKYNFCLNSMKNFYWASWADPEEDATSFTPPNNNWHLNGYMSKQTQYWPYYSNPYTIVTAGVEFPFDFQGGGDTSSGRYFFG